MMCAYVVQLWADEIKKKVIHISALLVAISNIQLMPWNVEQFYLHQTQECDCRAELFD